MSQELSKFQINYIYWYAKKGISTLYKYQRHRYTHLTLKNNPGIKREIINLCLIPATHTLNPDLSLYYDQDFSCWEKGPVFFNQINTHTHTEIAMRLF